jgi:rhodanese-related sulfurtransferase
VFVPTVTVSDVTDGAFLLDVRDPDEWEAGHAPEATHVPMMELPDRVGELPDDRDIVVVCRVGSRSAQVVAYLMAHGRNRVANLDGGMFAWHAAGRPVVSTDGAAGYVL